MKVVRDFRAFLVRSRMEDLSTQLSRTGDESAVLAWQLEAMNQSWAESCRTLPHAKALLESGRCPARFSDWKEFRASMPSSDRAAVRAQVRAWIECGVKANFWRATGGSTAEPLRIPGRREERSFTAANAWVGRSWYGIRPSDRLFMIWGHSHLLGQGWRGAINRRRRELSDHLLGYLRWSAYDLSVEAMTRAGQALLDWRPAYVVGYARALGLFCRANAARSTEFRRLGLKAVIATGESFGEESSAQELQEMFGAPVAMEYGAMETDVMAHTVPGGGYRVFWPSVHFELDAENNLFVTTLTPRLFPLFRYRIGDRLDLGTGGTILKFGRVLGRSNQEIALDDGSLIHSEALSHCVRELSGICGFQLVLRPGGAAPLLILVGSKLFPVEEEKLRRKLSGVAVSLERVDVQTADTLRQSIAGKSPMILDQR